MTHKEVVEKIEENNGEWKPSDEITFTTKDDDKNHIIATFEDGYVLQNFGHIEDISKYVYISNSWGPVKDAVHLLKYCSYVGIDTSEIKDLKPVVLEIEKVDEITSAKLSVYEKIFGAALRITIDQK